MKQKNIKNHNKLVGAGLVSAHEKGITLIALVITIILLLILAGVAINLVIGDNGILNHAKKAKEEHLQAQAREKLELVLLDLQSDKIIKPDYNENGYIDNKLRENNMFVKENIVIVDGWGFTIDRSVPKIEEGLGRLSLEELLKPIITQIKTEPTLNSIKIEIELSSIDESTISYVIREKGATVDTDNSGDVTSLEHTFNNLKEGTIYEIIISATNEYGTTTKTTEEQTDSPVLVTNIQLSETSITIPRNTTKQITYTVEPEDATNKKVKWESDTPEIATVTQQGLISAVKVGKGTITCKSEDGGTESKVNVEVTVPPVTNIQIIPEKIYIQLQTEQTIEYTVTPSDGIIQWTSSDETVATVDNTGKVTAKKEGTATITADGGNGKSDTCSVIVLGAGTMYSYGNNFYGFVGKQQNPSSTAQAEINEVAGVGFHSVVKQQDNGGTYLYSTEKIDFTPYKKLIVVEKRSSTSKSSNYKFLNGYIYDEIPTSYNSERVKGLFSLGLGDSTVKTQEFDISDINGSYFLGFRIAGISDVYIYEVRLE